MWFAPSETPVKTKIRKQSSSKWPDFTKKTPISTRFRGLWYEIRKKNIFKREIAKCPANFLRCVLGHFKPIRGRFGGRISKIGRHEIIFLPSKLGCCHDLRKVRGCGATGDLRPPTSNRSSSFVTSPKSCEFVLEEREGLYLPDPVSKNAKLLPKNIFGPGGSRTPRFRVVVVRRF